MDLMNNLFDNKMAAKNYDLYLMMNYYLNAASKRKQTPTRHSLFEFIPLGSHTRQDQV